MFVGHYAAALAAKAAEPKTPFWTLIAGCQLVDIGWSIFIATGVEHASLDPSLPGSSFVLSDMPWTHSLPGALGWSLGAGVLAKYLLRLNMRAAILIGLTVFSHWLLDLVVHRPDLELWPGGAKVGFALWNFPVPEQALEIGLLGVAGVWWAASRQKLGQPVWSGALFMAFLVALQIAVMFLGPSTPGPADAMTGLEVLAAYFVVTALSLPLDGKRTSYPEEAANRKV